MEAEHESTLVVDSGFSSTRVCAVHNHRVVPASVVRMPVGGRVMTNYLKDCISYRHINVADQQQLVEDIKLATARVVPDFPTALNQAKEVTAVRNVVSVSVCVCVCVWRNKRSAGYVMHLFHPLTHTNIQVNTCLWSLL